MTQRAGGGRTVPQIFIGETHVGGCDDLYALDHAGKLDPLLAGCDARRPRAADRHRRSGSEPAVTRDRVPGRGGGRGAASC